MSAMKQIAFDTLDYANKLKKAGLDPKIAEAQAELQAKVLDEATYNRLATKDDVFRVEKGLIGVKQDLANVKQDLDNVKKDLGCVKQDLNNVKKDVAVIKEDIVEMKEDISNLKKDIINLKFELLTKLGSTIVGCSAVLGVLMVVFRA